MLPIVPPLPPDPFHQRIPTYTRQPNSEGDIGQFENMSCLSIATFESSSIPTFHGATGIASKREGDIGQFENMCCLSIEST